MRASSEAEDIAQDSFYALWSNLRFYNPIIPSFTNPATLSARTNSFSEVEKRFV